VTANIQGRDEAAFAKAREAAEPAIGRVATLADAQWMLDHGATGFVGMIRDTETLDPDFVAKLRDLRITFAPALMGAGADLEVAGRNTLRLFQAGVPIALSGEGANALREAELLVQAGIPPLDVIVAATRNGAAALHDVEGGTIQAGKRANLLLLSANPGEDIRNLGRVELRLINGEAVR
jgi:imidazolonepropionase-like amidohydrolase